MKTIKLQSLKNKTNNQKLIILSFSDNQIMNPEMNPFVRTKKIFDITWFMFKVNPIGLQ